MQGVGHHHQAGLPAQLGNHCSGRAAAVDDDARVLFDPRNRGTGNGLLVGRNALAWFANELLRHADRAAIAT
jgi:hypothetical protein